MPKYRKKPVEIEAIMFKDEIETLNDLYDFMGKVVTVVHHPTNVPYLKVETLEGTMKANVGDYIIKGVQGEFYPCKPDIFEATYDKVGE